MTQRRPRSDTVGGVRVHIAIFVVAVACVASLLHGGGHVVDVAVEESADGLPLGPPPVLAGAAHPQETGVVALASEFDGIEPYAVRPPLPKMRLIAMDWTLKVVDESGYSFDPMGLISVVISSPDVTKFRSSITEAEIVISEVTARDTVRVVRDFPDGVEIAGLPLKTPWSYVHRRSVFWSCCVGGRQRASSSQNQTDMRPVQAPTTSRSPTLTGATGPGCERVGCTPSPFGLDANSSARSGGERVELVMGSRGSRSFTARLSRTSSPPTSDR